MFKKNLLLIYIGILFVGCGTHKRSTSVSTPTKKEARTIVSTKKTPKKSNPKLSYADAIKKYIDDYSGLAVDEMKTYKIPASITLAQGILESRSGLSELTQRSNNHFGIKCHKGWKGKKTYHDDDEKGECFRVYKHPKSSYKDHSLFLSGRKRYAKLFDLKITDYKGWARGLQKAGYATDKRYPNKLIKLIEDHELYRFDGKRGRKKSAKKERNKKKKSKSHTVKKGDTLYSISKKYDMTVGELKRANDLYDNIISIGQELKVNK